MHTLFDFVSNVNSIQYGLALLFVFGFIIFSEILKPRPFGGLLKSVAEDARFIKAQKKGSSLQLIKNIASAPVYILLYLIAVPVLFAQGVAAPVGRRISVVTSAGWSPVRAYFAGRGKTRKSGKDNPGRRASES